MPLPVPNLDDRKFQDILDEMRRAIPRYCPEWTDHNLSDPGITMLELFAWMAEMLLYRLNRVPDKSYVKFLELIGVRLEPAQAATTELTFRLTAPQPDDVVIAKGTAVGTVRTETHEAITFATDRDLNIRLPRLQHVLAAREGERFHDYRPALDNPQQGLGVFSDVPRPDDGLYLGFGNDLSGHILAITIRCRIEGIGVDPTDPPLVWEGWDRLESGWVPLRLEQDSTGGLNRDGVVILHTPTTSGVTAVDGTAAYWLRCRVVPPRPGKGSYSETPRVTGVYVESLGGLVAASHAFKVTGELLGTSDGSPGQMFQLQTLPVLPRGDGETLEIEGEEGAFEAWTEVAGFGSSGPTDAHFVLDDVSGTVQLGSRIRSPKGEEHQYGRVPTEGRKVRFSSYRSGGGVVGNVGARTLTVLKSSIPYVSSVTNYGPAIGGTDPEDLEHAKWRGPQTLRSRERAVTADDFEHLARIASPAVGRARCIMPQSAGVVRLMLVPAVRTTDGPIPAEQLQLPPHVRPEVQTFLDERRLLTAELMLEPASYVWVAVTARLRARPRADKARLAADAEAALYHYIHPLVGGLDGNGWPFGRTLFVAEIYSLLQSLDGVDVVEDAGLQQTDGEAGVATEAVARVTPTPDALICSARHQVTVG